MMDGLALLLLLFGAAYHWWVKPFMDGVRKAAGSTGRPVDRPTADPGDTEAGRYMGNREHAIREGRESRMLEDRIRDKDAQIKHLDRQVTRLLQHMEVRREARDKVMHALSLVQQHHFPGWRMDESNMCPICRDSRIFEHARTLLGELNLTYIPPDQPPAAGTEGDPHPHA